MIHFHPFKFIHLKKVALSTKHIKFSAPSLIARFTGARGTYDRIESHAHNSEGINDTNLKKLACYYKQARLQHHQEKVQSQGEAARPPELRKQAMHNANKMPGFF